MPWKYNPPPAVAGQPILVEHVQAILEIRDKLITAVAGPLMLSSGVLSVDIRTPFWVKITGAPTGVKHPWIERLPTTSGAWVDGYASGDDTEDPAYEVNGSTADLTNKYVLAWRDRTSNEVRFLYSEC